MKSILFSVTLLFCMSTFSQSNSSGTIKEIYTTQDGAVALKLDQGFSSSAINECPGHNGYAGHHTPDKALISALLTAFSAQKNVKLVIDGCDNSWLKIKSVFLTH